MSLSDTSHVSHVSLTHIKCLSHHMLRTHTHTSHVTHTHITCHTHTHTHTHTCIRLVRPLARVGVRIPFHPRQLAIPRQFLLLPPASVGLNTRWELHHNQGVGLALWLLGWQVRAQGLQLCAASSSLSASSCGSR